jgi:hypothetical protein
MIRPGQIKVQTIFSEFCWWLTNSAPLSGVKAQKGSRVKLGLLSKLEINATYPPAN